MQVLLEGALCKELQGVKLQQVHTVPHVDRGIPKTTASGTLTHLVAGVDGALMVMAPVTYSTTQEDLLSPLGIMLEHPPGSIACEYLRQK